MGPIAVFSVVNTVTSYCFLIHSCFFHPVFSQKALTHVFTYAAILILFIKFILGMRELHQQQKHNSFVKLLLSTFFVWQLHVPQYSSNRAKS